ncbi:MAG: transporter related protein [Bacteroidetes bacterium]|nr:transporter related protein [Bacteroidota bacterium]
MNPVNISLSSLGKKFGSEWIFRNLNTDIPQGERLLIAGGNGSGKSTLLQIISGYVTPNEGEVIFKNTQAEIDPDQLKQYVSFASPYLQLIEDFTLQETIEHVTVFKSFVSNISVNEVIETMELSVSKNKPVKQFSSGMKQRLKLGLAILADTQVLLLDEPVSNLDKPSIIWYRKMIEKFTPDRTVIVCSNNIEEEHFFCTRLLNVSDYKIKKTVV